MPRVGSRLRWMPQAEQRLIELREEHGLSFATIAKRMNRPEQSVQRHYNDLKKKERERARE